MRDKITGRNKLLQLFIDFIPKNLRLKLNPDRYCIEKFVEMVSKKVRPGTIILDAGAGPTPYRKFFSHIKYEATDFKDEFENLDFTCNLEKIPKNEETYDYILCTEVLEHVENPERVLKEFNRILKKGGKIFLTVPQSWKLHQEPHNYFYFTLYGLQILLNKANFKNTKIKKKGGYFWFLADAIRFNGILDQYKKYTFIYWPLRIVGYPFTNIILPFILFHLDWLDKEQKWTRGYLVISEKN